MQLDPVEYAILSQSVIAAAREMGVKLIRSAYSTILREARDGSAALLDAEGYTVAQAELIPMQLGSIGPIFQPCKAMFPKETLEPATSSSSTIPIPAASTCRTSSSSTPSSWTARSSASPPRSRTI
jgi:hypothetical protein